jgi:hypothetical protein
MSEEDRHGKPLQGEEQEEEKEADRKPVPPRKVDPMLRHKVDASMEKVKID